MLQGFPSLGKVYAPSVSVGLRRTSGVGLRLRVVAPSYQKAVVGELGSATLSQRLGVIELSLARSMRRVALLGTVGAGYYGLSAYGHSNGTGQATTARVDALAFDFGLGLRWPARGWLAAGVEAHGVLLAPSPGVQLGSEQVGRTGRPLLTLNVGALARF